ncbi:hypothetical protein AAHE18_09G117700 [Arachis hypogaea]
MFVKAVVFVFLINMGFSETIEVSTYGCCKECTCTPLQPVFGNTCWCEDVTKSCHPACRSCICKDSNPFQCRCEDTKLYSCYLPRCL